jgi:SagB-type dehydrogenase family enzyme
VAGIGDEFQRQTRYRRGDLPGGRLDWSARPQPFKVYPEAPRIPLPPPPGGGPAAIAEGSAATGGGSSPDSTDAAPDAAPPMSVWDALRARRSGRRYGGAPLTLGELGAVLWAASGVRSPSDGAAARTAPSAGGLYPIETYLVAHRIEGLDPGVYHYAVLDHALEQLSTAPAADLRHRSAAAALDQPIAGLCDGLLLWSAVLERTLWKYGQRGHRYVYIDAGHVGENLALAATALGLESCHIAALYDDEADALLGLQAPEETVLYLTTLGRAPGPRS